MVYTPDNVQPKTSVFVVDTKEMVQMVKSINTDNGVVLQVKQPMEVVGGVVKHSMRLFRSIHPIGKDRFGRPCLFHCYGEMPHGMQSL